MKGIIFVALSEMIQESHGHKLWNQVVQNGQLESEGVYTSASIYNDSEVVQLLSTLSKIFNEDINKLEVFFGRYLFNFFRKKYPDLFVSLSYKDFLKTLDANIHFEIKKMNPDATPPRMSVLEINEKEIEVIYKSKRKMCRLAEGLLVAAGEMFGEVVTVHHSECMRKGDGRCCLVISVHAANEK